MSRCGHLSLREGEYTPNKFIYTTNNKFPNKSQIHIYIYIYIYIYIHTLQIHIEKKIKKKKDKKEKNKPSHPAAAELASHRRLPAPRLSHLAPPPRSHLAPPPTSPPAASAAFTSRRRRPPFPPRGVRISRRRRGPRRPLLCVNRRFTRVAAANAR
uniref:Uncharacterized protein n=1 Tax=Oryza sativa subsp. japonica TaxID=39947 RepID=Q5Z6I0_ORYSJ|nr:hypothetical protein [Oryza sativa Japonica Group]